ncbi:acyltransferase [Shewanella xiamenensis]|uniref:acyltransferase n=1 Tax=Shewanella xiamenensis TaxID=332186 RepID=UPI00214FB4D1|nr:hypothetical protein [Shewanella xiamenensis]MCR4535214.1 hypothetical protein [Shewanella xiamenensis]
MISNLKNKVSKIKESNLILYCFIKRIWFRPYFLGFDFICCYFYSLYLSWKIFGFSFFPRVFFSNETFRVIVNKSGSAIIQSNSKIALVFESFIHGVNRTVIQIGNNAKLEISNTFQIGDGCKIIVSDDAQLMLKGCLNGESSGVTCDSLIMCSKNIEIGGGTIISWGCYLSDSSNHYVNGRIIKDSIIIGNNVWVSDSCTIGPGTVIGDGCIIGSKSYVKGTFGGRSLLVGCPAKIKRTNIDWSR